MSYIGRHISVCKSILESIKEYMLICNGNAVQVFVGSPKTYIVPTITEEEGNKVKDFCKKHDCYLVVHGAYIYNLCNNKLHRQIPSLSSAMVMADRLGADLVIHQGKNIDKKSTSDAMHDYVSNLVKAVETAIEMGAKNRILLENSSRQGNEIGYSIKHLQQIYEMIPERLHSMIGFCLDLCHVFVAGKLDLRHPLKVEKYFAKWDKHIGLDKLKVIHFNDSATEYGKRNDHHEDILEGYIGCTKRKGCIDGFTKVANIAHKYKIPLICETPLNMRSANDEFNLVKDMMNHKHNQS